jgi:6-pyruvoyltetrahydropterin/6-carboxytetrahydropterin synthase
VISISRLYKFEAAHFLPRVPPGHKCRNMHGHSYRLKVEFTGPIRAVGWIEDFSKVDDVMGPIVSELDHCVLNNIVENPTSELLVAWLVSKIQVEVGLTLVSLELRETSKSGAKWTPL